MGAHHPFQSYTLLTSAIVQTDWDTFKDLSGHKTAASARECFRQFKMKKLEGLGSTPATLKRKKDAEEGVDAESPAKKTKRGRKPSKKAQDADGADADGQEGHVKAEQDSD